MSDVVVRPAHRDDADTIARFNREMAKETENRQLPPDEILSGVEAVLDNPDLGFYRVARVGGTIAGCLLITTEWSDWRDGLFWWIQSVYVAPEFRRRGVFSALYEHIRNMAREKDDVCGLRLYVEKDNERAKRTYLRLGMIETDYRLLEEEF